MVRKAKELVKQKGILSTPNPKPGHTLPVETTDLVQSFYESDEVSRTMPGSKDFVSVRQSEGQTHVQKRLVLSNLKEIYQLFKENFPDKAIGFSKFAELHPKHCVLAGASGTHAVCVCTIHQNPKLMIIGGRIAALRPEDNIPLINIQSLSSTEHLQSTSASLLLKCLHSMSWYIRAQGTPKNTNGRQSC